MTALTYNVTRVDLGPPCPVCYERAHDRQAHGELVQVAGLVLTEDELALIGLDAS